MAEVTLKINNRGYGISCEAGQEQRLVDLSHYVDSRLREIASSGAASHEAHLMVLTSLVLADEIFELREEIAAIQSGSLPSGQTSLPLTGNKDVEEVINRLTAKVERITARINGVEDSTAAA